MLRGRKKERKKEKGMGGYFIAHPWGSSTKTGNCTQNRKRDMSMLKDRFEEGWSERDKTGNARKGERKIK